MTDRFVHKVKLTGASLQIAHLRLKNRECVVLVHEAFNLMIDVANDVFAHLKQRRVEPLLELLRRLMPTAISRSGLY